MLVGGNGAGKTSVLEAIDKVFGAGRRGYGFREEDLAPGASRLRVTFEIRPSEGATFTPEEHGLFETHVDLDALSREVVDVAGEAGFDDDGVFRSRGFFLKSDGGEDGVFDAATRSQISFFYLPSARDAQREFDDRSGLWARLAGLLEKAHNPELVERLTAEAGRELVTAVIGQERLDGLAGTVTAFVNAMYGQTEVSAELRATAVDFRTLLRRTSLVVGEPGGLAPLEQHSTGLQTLALFGLFRAYLETAGGPLLAAGLEEPEIHLSPHVARTLIALASESGNQVIFTTHSPAVSDRMGVGDVRLLRRSGGRSVAREVPPGSYTDEERARLQRELRTVGTEFLFARSVLLCEGPSELGALPEFAEKLDVDLDRVGATVLPVGGGGFRPYLILLGETALEIPHAVLCDNDQTLKRLVKALPGWGACLMQSTPKASSASLSWRLYVPVAFSLGAKGTLRRTLCPKGATPTLWRRQTFSMGRGT